MGVALLARSNTRLLAAQAGRAVARLSRHARPRSALSSWSCRRPAMSSAYVGARVASMTRLDAAATRCMSGSPGAVQSGGAVATPVEKIFDVTGANFAQVINNSEAPVIIVCYVPEENGISNTALKKFEAEVSRAAGVMLGRLDVEKEQELAVNLQLTQVPTAFAIHEKKVVNRINGAVSDQEIEGFVAQCSHLARLATGEGLVQQAAEHLSSGEVEEALKLYGNLERDECPHLLAEDHRKS